MGLCGHSATTRWATVERLEAASRGGAHLLGPVLEVGGDLLLSLNRMASQTRSGRNIHRPVLFAEEQWRLEDDQRRRSRMRRMRREQPNGEQLLIEGGAEDLDLEEDEQEPAI